MTGTPERITKILDSKPVYAVVGASDLAVAALRGLQARAGEVPLDRVTRRVDALQAELASLPTRTQARAAGVVEQAGGTYGELARRGASVVRRVRDQAAVQLSTAPAPAGQPAGVPAAEALLVQPADELVEQPENVEQPKDTAVSRDTAARTTARKSASSTRRTVGTASSRRRSSTGTRSSRT